MHLSDHSSSEVYRLPEDRRVKAAVGVYHDWWRQVAAVGCVLDGSEGSASNLLCGLHRPPAGSLAPDGSRWGCS